MRDRLIQWSLHNRALVLVAAIVSDEPLQRVTQSNVH
jgi:hypothetical protein